VVYNLTTAQSYPTIAISTTPFTTYSSALVNTCVDGEALTGLISDYPIHVAPYAPATTGQPAILSISILGNDIANICPSGCTYTEASYEALFTSYINRATAAGFQIEFLLQWPQDGRTTTQENIVRNDINAWFQANPSVSWIINALGFMTCTTTCATNSTYYQSDGVHETAYASGLIAGLIQTLHASSWVPTQNLTASIIINQNLSTTLGFHTPTGFFTAGQFNTTNGFVPANGIDALAAKKPWYIYDTIPTGGGIMGINPSGFQEQLFTLSSGTIAFGAMSNSLVFSPWDTVNSLGLSNFGIIGDDGQSMGIQTGSGNNQELFTSTSTGKVSLGYTTGGVFTPWLTASASGVTVPLFTPASVPNAALANSSTQVNGQTCVLGGSCTIAASNTAVNTPVWLQYLGDGSSGANINASGNMTGEYYYTNFTVPYGNTVTVNYPSGLIIHATGACTIAGTIEANGATAGAAGSPGAASSGGGGSGGGASAGTTGGSYYSTTDGAQTGGGTAGAASGGNGGNGASGVPYKRIFLASGWGQDGQWASGGMGKQGANSGGSAGNGGAGVMLMCGSITGTDGTNIGIIDASGQTGGNAAANSTGAGSGGGGGVVVLSSQTAVTTWPTINTPGGAGGTCGSFTTCGTGGSGSAGWSAEFQGW
jgi:hypothetical protein